MAVPKDAPYDKRTVSKADWVRKKEVKIWLTELIQDIIQISNINSHKKHA